MSSLILNFAPPPLAALSAAACALLSAHLFGLDLQVFQDELCLLCPLPIMNFVFYGITLWASFGSPIPYLQSYPESWCAEHYLKCQGKSTP